MITFEISEQLLIRTVLPSDWEDLLRIGADRSGLRLPQSEADLLLVIEQENQLVGLLWLREVESAFEIQQIEIVEAYHGQGLGSLLLAMGKQVASQQGKSLILTSPERLLSFFALNDFEDIDESSDGYVMIWSASRDKKE